MCIPMSSRKDREKGPPEAYRIHRLGESDEGFHDRRHSSVERHLRNAPGIPERNNPKKYPHEHRNQDLPKPHYPRRPPGSYYEYPTKDFPYDRQNARGRITSQTPGGRAAPPQPGYTRTITDRNKNIQGVSYHPLENRSKLVRAEEIYPPSSSRWCRK